MVRVSVPITDRPRAREYYLEVLGLSLEREHQFAVEFMADDTRIALVESTDAGKATYSIVTFEIENIDARMAELRSRGVEFEDYDLGFVSTFNGKATIDGAQLAWFKDSEGNLLALAQL